MSRILTRVDCVSSVVEDHVDMSVFHVRIRHLFMFTPFPRGRLPWRFGACALNVYQALPPPPHTEGPGYEVNM